MHVLDVPPMMFMGLKYTEEMDDQFMEKNPDMRIERVIYPDVVMFHTGPSQSGFADYQLPLDDYIKDWRDEIPEDVWDWHRKDGNPDNPVQMVPLTLQGVGVYYNKANLRKAGLNPDKDYKKWSEFLAACEALKEAGITPITYGSPTTASYALQLIWGSMLGDDVETIFQPGQANFRDPRIRKGVEYLLELKRKGYFEEEQLSYNYFWDSRESFSQGKGGFFIGMLSDRANWKEFSDAFGKKNCGYFPNWNLPESVLEDAQVLTPGRVGYSIMSTCKRPDLAMRYIEFWAVGEGAQNLLLAGQFPPSAKLHIDAVGGRYPVVIELIQAVSDGPVVLPYWYYLPNMAGIGDNYIELLITEETGVDEFIDAIQENIEVVLDPQSSRPTIHIQPPGRIPPPEWELISAALNGVTERVKKLLRLGADVNARDRFSMTALTWAAKHGHTSIVRILLQRGADVNVRDESGNTALMFAADEGYPSIVQILLEAGANVNERDESGNTALMFAAMRCRPISARALIDAGADVNARNNAGKTVLTTAKSALFGCSDVEKLLRKAGAKE